MIHSSSIALCLRQTQHLSSFALEILCNPRGCTAQVQEKVDLYKVGLLEHRASSRISDCQERRGLRSLSHSGGVLSGNKSCCFCQVPWRGQCLILLSQNLWGIIWGKKKKIQLQCYSQPALFTVKYKDLSVVQLLQRPGCSAAPE